MAGIILRDRGFKVVQKVHVAPMGVPEGGPPSAKTVQISNIFSRSRSRTVKFFSA